MGCSARAWTAVAVLALAAAAASCGAGRDPVARPPVVTIVQDDAEMLHRPPARIAATLDDLRDLGVDWLRVTAGWSVIAPAPRATRRPAFDATDPAAYPEGAWDALDRVARMAAARGLRLAIDIAFWAPRWAVGRPARRPERQRDAIAVRHYADFAQAVARRYTRAVAFTVWNEPNHNALLLPQWTRSAGVWRPASPHLYRAMVQAAVPRIEAAAPRALVLVGATSSVGAERGSGPDDRMAPLTFLREMACVDRALRPLARPECAGFVALPGDDWSHHPYSLDLAPWQANPQRDNVRMADLGRLASLLSRLHAAGRTLRPLALYLTEAGYRPIRPTRRRASGSPSRRAGCPRPSGSRGESPRCAPSRSSSCATCPSVRGAARASAGATTSPGCASRTAARSPSTRRSRWASSRGARARGGSPSGASCAPAPDAARRRSPSASPAGAGARSRPRARAPTARCS